MMGSADGQIALDGHSDDQVDGGAEGYPRNIFGYIKGTVHRKIKFSIMIK